MAQQIGGCIKMKKEEMLKVLIYAGENLGFHGWTYELELNGKVADDEEANVFYYDDIHKLKVVVSKETLKFDDERIKNVLVHEIVHAKVGLMWHDTKKLVNKLMDDTEEKMVNEITNWWIKK